MSHQYTNEELTSLTKKEVYAIARKLADAQTTPQAAISKYSKDKLVDYIEEVQKMAIQSVEAQDKVETANAEAIPTPEEFFERVKRYNTKLEIHRACNELLEKLETEYAPSTVSKKLTYYKKPFYTFTHEKEELNEIITTTKGANKQSIAANLLKLSQEQNKVLNESREESELARKGVTAEGEIREVELPEVEIKKVIEKAIPLLKADQPELITCGILPLIGLRRNEQQMPYRTYLIDGELVDIQREFKVVGKFLIAVQGLSKKHGDRSWFLRPTLVPAEMIIEAQKRFLTFPKVRELTGDYEKFNDSALRKSTDRRFKEIWGDEFSTIEAYSEKGVKIDNNASTHKSRAFYIWALFPVLKYNKYNLKQAKAYLQRCLGHDDSKDTEKYFNRYDENQFTQGVDIEIPLNLKEVGKATEEKVFELAKEWEEEKLLEAQEKAEAEAEVKQEQLENLSSSFEGESKESSEETPLDKFIEEVIKGLSNKLQAEFSRLSVATKNPAKALTILINNLEKINTPPPKKVDIVEDSLKEIFGGIFLYNSAQPEDRDKVYPTYSLVNKIYSKLLDKEVGVTVYQRVFDELKTDIEEKVRLQNITEKQNNFHRKRMPQTIVKIVQYVDHV